MTSPSRLKRVVDAAPIWALALVAQALSHTRRLGFEPGWYFDKSEEDRSSLAEVRRTIWQRFARERIERPIDVRWYEGLRLRLYLGNDLSKCLYVGGSFEPNEFALLDSILTDGMVVVDGGANDGIYSLFASTRVGAAGQVLAFEPSPREYGRLEANLRLNHAGNVATHLAALGSKPGRGTLAIASFGHEGQNTVGESVSNPNVETIDRVEVAVVTLDDIVESAGLDRLDVLKLDVEGSEVAALRGAESTVTRFRPVLQLEVEEGPLGQQGSSKSELLELLGSHDYETWVFDDATGRLRRSDDEYELHRNVVAAPSGWTPPAQASARTPRTHTEPYLSVVATARNDNHGGDLLHRIDVFANGLAQQTRRFGIPTELVLVEWNPPTDRPRLVEAITWPDQDAGFKIRVVEVPAELHARLEHADQLPLFQMIAKNVGIRRSRGRYVLATNVDVLFSDELMEAVATRRLQRGRVYRADRHDVLGPIDPRDPIATQLAAAAGTVIRTCRIEGTLDARTGEYFPIYGPMTSWPGPLARWGRMIRFGAPAGTTIVLHTARRFPLSMLRGVRRLLLVFDPEARRRRVARLGRQLELAHTGRGWERLARPLTFLWRRGGAPGDAPLEQREWAWMALRRRVDTRLAVYRSQRQIIRELWEREKARVRLHTNACGDFTMMAREDWFRVRGYAELEIFSMHIDSLLLYEAHYARIRQTLLPGAVYHLEHGGGFKPDAEGVKTLNEQLDRKAIPQVTYEQFLDWTMAMYRQRRPLGLNSEAWGFGAQWLAEATPRAHASVDRVQEAV